MKYGDLLKSNQMYGNDEESIIKLRNYEDILENVVVAPWWSHEIFVNSGLKMKQINDKIFNFYGEGVEFTFIEIKLIGAPALMERVLPLGLTKCKNVIFLGSAGALDANIGIGDIVIPKYSICGDGASRYLNSDLEDEFGKKEYPTNEFNNRIIDVVKRRSDVRYHVVPNYSVDTVFAQFYHLDNIINLGAKTIEMETACLFKCCELMNLNVSAILCISDNTLLKKSLYAGRTDEDNNYRHKVRDEIIPSVVIDVLRKEDN